MLLVNTINAWNRCAIAFRKLPAGGLAHLLRAGPIVSRSCCKRQTSAAGDCFQAPWSISHTKPESSKTLAMP
jgi:hypothetical protein